MTEVQTQKRHILWQVHRSLKNKRKLMIRNNLGESQEVKRVTFGELRENVRVLAHAMKDFGIGEGDRVVGR